MNRSDATHRATKRRDLRHHNGTQPARQLSVLRSLFRTLHPYLDDLQANLSQLTQSGLNKATTHPETDPMPQASVASSALRSVTDEHLIAELQNITSQPASAKKPRRNRRHYSRDTLLELLEEASVRIQVLETELEIARSDREDIPLLTDEWESTTTQSMSAPTPKSVPSPKPIPEQPANQQPSAEPV